MAVKGNQRALVLGLWRFKVVAGASDGLWVKGLEGEAAIIAIAGGRVHVRLLCAHFVLYYTVYSKYRGTFAT